MAANAPPPRNTSSNAHRYVVHEYVRRNRAGTQCWFLAEDTKRMIRLKTIGETVAIHRYLYALFVGPVPENVALTPRPADRLGNKQCCNTKGCINPYHQAMEPARFKANPLDLDHVLELLHDEFSPREKSALAPLPANVTKRSVVLCKYLHSQGKNLSEISAGCGLPNHEIMRAINGRYDDVLRDSGDPIRQRARDSFLDQGESREDLLRARSEMLGHGSVAMPSDSRRSDYQSMVVAKVDNQGQDGFGTIVGGARVPGEPPDPKDPPHSGPVPPWEHGDDEEDDLGSTDEAAWLATLRGN
jgi:hypothetical protein